MPISNSKTIQTLIDFAEQGSFTAGYVVEDTGAALALDAAANGGLGRFISAVNGNPAVVFTSTETSVDRVNAVNAATTGVVTATINASAAELANLTGWGSGSHNQYTIHVDGQISLAELQALDAKTDGMIYADVTGTASDLAVTLGGLTNNNITVHDVHVTDLGTVAELNVIWAHRGSGTIYFNGIRDDVSNLVNADGTAGAPDAATWYAAQASFDVQGLPSIAQIKKIDDLNGSGAIAYSTIADSYANINADAGAFGANVGAGKDIVVIAGSAPDGKPTIADLGLNGVAGLVDSNSQTYASSVTAPVITDAASNLMSDVNATQGGHGKYIATATTVNVVDDNNDIASITDLNDIAFAFKGTTLTWDSVSGDANDLAVDASWNGHVGRFVTGGHKVFVDNGTATVDNLNDINQSTTGKVTASLVASAADLVRLDGRGAGSGNDYTIQVTGPDISVSALVTLDDKTTGVITASVSGAASVLADLVGVDNGNHIDVTVTGPVSLAQLKLFDAHNGNGALVYTEIKDDANNFAHPDTGALTADATTYVKSGIGVTLNSAATIAQLDALDSANGGGVLAYTVIADTVANLQSDQSISGGNYTAGKVVHVIADAVAGAPSISQLAAIADYLVSPPYSVDAVVIKDISANLAADITSNIAFPGVGRFINGTVNVEVDGVAALPDLLIIDPATDGVITFTKISGTGAALAAETTPVSSHYYVSGSREVIVDAGTASIGYLNTINAATTGKVTADLIASAQDLLTLDGPGTGSANEYAIQVTGPNISASALATLDGKTTGVITATVATADASDIAAALTNLGLNNVSPNLITVTVNGGAGIADLKALALKTTLTYSSISDSVENLFDAGTAALKLGYDRLVNGHAVTVTGAPSIAQLAALNTAHATSLAFTQVTDTAANLAADQGAGAHYSSNVNIRVIPASGVAPTISDLSALTVGNGKTITVVAIKDTSGNLAADINAVTNVGTFIKGTTNVEFIGAANILDLKKVDIATAGNLTYTDIAGAGNVLAANTEITGPYRYVTGSKNIIVDANSATIDNLNSINAATTGVVTASLSASASDLASLAGPGSGSANQYAVTVTGPITVADLVTLDGKTAGRITASVSGAADALATSMAGLDSNATTNLIAVTVTTAPTIAQLTAIDGRNGAGAVTLNVNIADTAANLKADNLTVNHYSRGSNVTVLADNGLAPSIQDLTDVDVFAGTVSYAAIRDTAANLASLGVLTAGASTYLPGGATNVDVSVTTSATIAQLAAVDARNGAGAFAYTSIVDSITNVANDIGANVYGVYVKDDHAVNVSGTPGATITQLNKVKAATTGAITWADVSGSVTNLANSTGAGGFVVGNHAVSVDTIAGVASSADISKLNQIGLVNTGGITASFSAIAGDLQNLTATGNFTIGVSGTISASAVAALDLKTTGVITGTVDAASGSVLATALGSVANTNNLNVTVTGAASLADLNTINNHNGNGSITWGAVTGSASDIFADAAGTLTSLATTYVINGKAVSLTSGATIAQLTTLGTLIGAGNVTYSTVRDSSANLAGDINGSFIGTWIKSNTTVVVDGGLGNANSTTADIDQLARIDAATNVPVTYGAVSGSAPKLVADTVTNGTGLYIPGHAVTVTGVATVDDLNKINAATTSAVTASITASSGDLSLLDGPGSGAANKYTITVSGSLAVADLPALVTLDGKTAGQITATVSGAADALAASMAGLDSNATTNAITVIVTTAPTIAQYTAIDGRNGAGAITLNVNIADTAANLKADNLTANHYSRGANVTVLSDAGVAPSLADLGAVDQFAGTISYAAIRDTAVNFANPTTGAKTVLASTYLPSVGSPNVDVTVTTAATIVQVAAIDGGNGTGALSYSVADTVANVLTDINGNPQGTYVKTGINVDVSSDPLVAHITELNTIRGVVGSGATMLWGKVEGDLSDLAADALLRNGSVYNGFVSGNHEVTVLNLHVPVDAMDVAKINAIDTANTSVIHATLVGSAEDLLALNTGSNLYDLLVNDGASVSVANLNALALRTAGNIDTSTSVSGYGSVLAGLNGSHNVFDVSVVTDQVVTGVSVGDLALIDAHTGGDITYSTIRDQASNLANTGGALTLNAAHYLKTWDTNTHSYTATDGSYDVEVIGGNVAQLNAVALHTTGVVTASISGDAATLSGLEHTGPELNHNDYTVTVTGDVSLADLALIDDATSQSLNTDGTYGRVFGSMADLIADEVANQGAGYVNGAHDVRVVGTLTSAGDLMDLSEVAGLTSGRVYASVSASASDLIANVGDTNVGPNKNVYTVQVTDQSISVSDANLISGLTDGLVSANVSGNVSDVAGLAEIGNNFDVDVSGVISIADLRALDAKTDGVITSNVTASVSDLVDPVNGLPVGNTNITNVTVIGSVSIQNLIDIDARNGNGGLIYDGGIFDTAGHLAADAALNLGEGGYLAGDHDVTVLDDLSTILDDVSLSQLFAIDAANGSGSLTYGAVRDDLASLATDVDVLRTVVTDRYVRGHEVNVDGTVAATVANGYVTKLNHVLGATDQIVHATVNGTVSVLADLTVEANNDLIVSVAGTVAAADWAKLNTIAAATTNVVTATVSGASSDLIKLTELTNSNNYTVTVTTAASIDNLQKIDSATIQNLATAGTYGEIASDLASLYTDATSLGGYIRDAHVVTVTGGTVAAADWAKLNAIAGKTTGVVTAAVSGATSDLVNLNELTNFNNYTVAVTTAASISELQKIDSATSQNLASAGTYGDIVSDLSSLYTDASSVGGYIRDAHAVTVTDTTVAAADWAKLNLIAGKTTGVVTATVIGAAADLVKLNELTNFNNYTVTVTTAASIGDLQKIDSATSQNLASTGTYGDIVSDLSSLYTDAASVGGYIRDAHAVTVSGGTVSAADWAKLNAIAGKTTGVVTAAVSGAASDLVNLNELTNFNNYTVTVSTAASISDLQKIDSATSQNLASAGTYGGIASDLGSLYTDATSVGGYIRDAHAVTVTGGTVSAADWAKLNAIAGKTAGVVTATVTGATSDLVNLNELTNFNNFTVAVTTAASISELQKIDSATSQNLASAGTYADIVSDLSSLYTDATSLGGYIRDAHAVTVSGGTVAAADWAKLNAIAGKTTGVVTAAVSGATSDLVNLNELTNFNNYTVAVTTAASISELQ